MRPESTISIRLLRDCVLGKAGQSMRIGYKEGMKACERGDARMNEWKPPVRKVRVDVQKNGT